MPPSLAILFSRTAGKLVLDQNGGASATAILGRFSAFSSAAESLCREIASTEAKANPDVIFAEIHQLSDTHVDNINRRRPVYDHIIPVNAFTAGTGQNVVALSDLLVSLKGDEIVLESSSLHKRVIPRLPTAYNFHHNQLAIFRFLGDLQHHQLQANLTFDLEKLFPGLDFYPRVEYGRAIVSLAKWRLSATQIRPLTEHKLSISALHLLRQEQGIPEWVTMGISDQQLVFNLAEDEQALFFLECLKGSGTVLIREYLLTDHSVTSGKQRLAAQYIAVLTRKSAAFSGLVSGSSPDQERPQRDFRPGSEWIYLKIYCTNESADHLLITHLGPFIRANRSSIKSWFFIRYYDPDPHLRLRLLTTPENYGTLMMAFQVMAAGDSAATRIHAIRQDTYQRELERYGKDLIFLVEDLFCAGSELALDRIADPESMHEPSELAVFGLVYRMAGAFMQEISELAVFFKTRADAFMQEFGESKAFRVSLDRKYRNLSKTLIRLLERASDAPRGRHGVTGSKDFWTILELIAANSGTWPAGRRWQLAADLIHMQVNRCFSHQQRQHEALICFCLHQYTASAMAQSARS
ncbi:thiopeptide-type bacteriocin biosynthesis protein [Mucilaginibacter phyllosphaerae]